MHSEKTYTSVLTTRGMAAISSIVLAGVDAHAILDKVFQTNKPLGPSNPSGLTATSPSQGRSFWPLAGEELKILHGSIVDGQRVIDEVVVGCENEFVIHCHGNPLLVEQIVTLFQSHGAELIDADRFAMAGYQRQSKHTIEAEARLAMRKSATVAGVKFLQAQINGGLSQWATKTLSAIDSLDSEEIQKQCREILERGEVARRIIEGVRIVIAGPPNSGKSTLLNCLAGAEQVIVSDTAGTTRDWVSITGHLGDGVLCAEFIDTAGLDEDLAGADSIERTAQKMTRGLLDSCDLVLYVQDITEVRSQKSEIRVDTKQPIIYVCNKCDLIQEHKNTRIQEHMPVSISAKDNEGIDLLVREMIERLGVAFFDAAKPAAFTERQRELLLSVLNADQPPEKMLSDLLCSENSL